MHTMQAAMALSPVNKAQTTLESNDIFLIQEIAHERYRLWIVSPDDIPVWGGNLNEREIDKFPTKYLVDPAARIWEPMGLAPDYQAMETALQALAEQVLNLSTELMTIKKTIEENGCEASLYAE